jgi:isocitrate dehydrogenase
MVDSDKGITNLHVPSNVIIDASMPAAIRSSGQMWGPDGKLHDTKALIPDRCYARIYQEVINFCKKYGAFDVTKIGNVANIGLMAKKAQEYGSHDKTFEISSPGKIQIIDQDDEILIEHDVNKGDIWRMCRTQEAAINNWIELAIGRFKTTNSTTIFWLDENRSHDKILIDYVQKYLNKNKLNNSSISILSPHKAMQETLHLINLGKNVISVTGNVLRDYLTDLFPILELGTSAKMLSIVPLLAGGGLYETGAGGSAPKHVSQFIKEGHLRWDSLGEFLAIMVSIEDLATKTNNQRAQILSEALNKANTMILENNKSPSRKVGEPDNRHSHFYLAVYWSQALSEQSTDEELGKIFLKLNRELCDNEEIIVNELSINQGKVIDIGGYYHPNKELAEAAMRPSKTLNKIIESLKN